MKKTGTIAVIGQGYVGLPLALSFAMNGQNVIGVESNPEIRKNLASGQTLQNENWNGKSIETILKEQLASGRYRLSGDTVAAVREAETICLTVGIPVADGQPVLDSFNGACEQIGHGLQPGSLVLIRSTVIPGTSESYCVPLFERLSGLKFGESLFVAYVPERIAEGSAFEEFRTLPTLIGSTDPQSREKAAAVIRINSRSEMIFCHSAMEAETSKVLENLQRDTNIALAQEFARFAEAAGMNAIDVIKLANTHPRVHMMEPGPGVGGYCIPNAFYYLAHKAAELGISLPIMQAARDLNDQMPETIVSKTVELLTQAGKELQEARVIVIGLGMKDYSPDDRLSPSVEICEQLAASGFDVRAYDPNVAKKYPYKIENIEEAAKDADAMLILNKISRDFRPSEFFSLLKHPAVILDTRNLVQDVDLPTGAVFWRI